MMKIGDKVRLMRGTEEGFVTKLLPNSLIEVEIEDGFAIPVLASELVIVSSEESTAFSDGATIDKRKQTVNKAATQQAPLKGYHLGIIPLNDSLLSIYFINPYTVDLLLIANEVNQKKEERSILSEKIFAGHSTKITERNMNQISTWNPISFSLLKENNSWSFPIQPQKFEVKIKPKHFQKEKIEIPILNKKGYLIPLEQQGITQLELEHIDVNQLKEILMSNKSENPSKDKVSNHLQKEVDLHIEEIDPNHDTLAKEDILQIQLNTFEEKLDQAIAAGLDEIIFVHGVGNGTLKNVIHKKLGKMDNIQFFKDTQKEKFGFGATMVKIK